LEDKLAYLSRTDRDIGVLLRFATQYPKVYKEMIDIEREARGLEKDQAGFILRQEDTPNGKHDPDVQRVVESSTTKTGDETAQAQENPLPEGGEAKTVQIHDEYQDSGGRTIKLPRRLPI
jgi:hypothetical protein